MTRQSGANSSIGIATLAAALAISACGQSDQKATLGQPLATAASSTQVAATTLEAKPRAGPSILTDSTIIDPRFDTSGNKYVLRLPTEMARTLYDSLPGFVPIQQSSYPPEIAAKRNAALSVVVGDFNGDSRKDLVAVGKSQDTPVFLMLLGKSAQIQRPRLIVIGRPAPGTPSEFESQYFELVGPRRIADPDNPNQFFELRTDGAWARNALDDKISAIYFWDHGEVSQYSIGGD